MGHYHRLKAARLGKAKPAPTTEAAGIPPWDELRRMSTDDLRQLVEQHGFAWPGSRMQAASVLNKARA